MDIYIGIIVSLVAFLYASIGHGGASGYLAILAMFSVPITFMKPTALVLNLFVAGVSFIMFYRAGYFRVKKLVPFIITSIPLAFLGGKTSIDPYYYKLILGLFLIIAVLRMMMSPKERLINSIDPPLLWSLIIGGGLGFFSGMIGIGGGIILSPILILFGWANLKEAAAVSAIFIFLNSASGLFGLISSGVEIHQNIYIWICFGLIGGLIGGFSGSLKLNFSQLRFILAFVLILASFKLFVI